MSDLYQKKPALAVRVMEETMDRLKRWGRFDRRIADISVRNLPEGKKMLVIRMRPPRTQTFINNEYIEVPFGGWLIREGNHNFLYSVLSNSEFEEFYTSIDEE